MFENPWTMALTTLGIMGFVFVILQLCRRDVRLSDRIRTFHGRTAGDAAEETRKAGDNTWFSAVRRVGEVLLPRGEAQRSQLQKMLVQAGYYSSSAATWYVVLQLTLGAALFGIAHWGGRWLPFASIDRWIGAGIIGCAAYLLPWIWLRRRKAVRHRILNRSLPDVLDLMVTCLDAGMSLEAVIQRVSQEVGFVHELLADELRRVQREMELGAPPDRALQSFADRTDAEIVRSLATVCHQSRKYGARISESLRTHADMLRDQREQSAEEAAQKASVKILFPTLLCLFPAIFVVLAGPAAIQIAENFTGKQAQTSTTE